MKTKFSKEARRVIHAIEKTGGNIFVTGNAGTGKSTLLEHIRLHSRKKIIVLAPTGISAINVNGETIHSFFGLKPGFELDEAREMRITDKQRAKFRPLKTIFIDEISMVRADLMDAIDTVLRRTRRREDPFGGVQMVFFGDLFQLPPVVTPGDREKLFSEYPSPYFFDAKVFHERRQESLFGQGFELSLAELTTIYRQRDPDFIGVLNAVRNSRVTDEHLALLNGRHMPGFVPPDEETYVHLVTTNAAAARINQARLARLEDEPVTFHARQTGKVARNLYPNDEEVTLCAGAQVMFICNDAERRWVNGTIGTVLGIEEAEDEDRGGEVESRRIVRVEKQDGQVVEAGMHTWEISRYVYQRGSFERDIMGSFTQIPLRLAWAITIHKSQGKTFDKVVVDLGGGTFAHGQTYVALSRCTSLSGMVLRQRFSRSHIIMDERVRRFRGNERILAAEDSEAGSVRSQHSCALTKLPP